MAASMRICCASTTLCPQPQSRAGCHLCQVLHLAKHVLCVVSGALALIVNLSAQAASSRVETATCQPHAEPGSVLSMCSRMLQLLCKRRHAGVLCNLCSILTAGHLCNVRCVQGRIFPDPLQHCLQNPLGAVSRDGSTDTAIACCELLGAPQPVVHHAHTPSQALAALACGPAHACCAWHIAAVHSDHACARDISVFTAGPAEFDLTSGGDRLP